MKAQLKFKTEFTIPKCLYHAGPGPETNTEEWSDICNDYISVHEGKLFLSSSCGSTTFISFEETQDGYTVFGNTVCSYEGAWGALNAVHGIKFPECEVGCIESTLGRYETLEDYELARKLILPLIKNLQRFLPARRDSKPRTADQATSWVTRLEERLGQVIALDDCGNPINEAGSTSWIS